jgi:uncharacterized protein
VASVSVRGEAFVPAQPDTVSLMFGVSATRETPAEALADVAGRSALLGEVFDAFGIERPQRLTEGVSVSPREEYDDRGRPLQVGFAASNRILISVSEPSRVGELIVEGVQRAGARVEGPWWRVAPTNEAWARARREAVLDARRRAEAYSAALGVQLGSVIEITEPAVRSGGGFGPYGYAMLAPVSGIEVESGDLGVSATIDVTFALEPE